VNRARRDWSDARRKVDDENRCRRCLRSDVRLEAAHVLGRRYDKPRVEGSTTKVLYVHPDSIWVACTSCHQLYDAHRIGILGFLTPAEQVRAVQDAGSIESARRRLDPLDYSPTMLEARERVVAEQEQDRAIRNGEST
jgi:hypothetical protein